MSPLPGQFSERQIDLKFNHFRRYELEALLGGLGLGFDGPSFKQRASAQNFDMKKHHKKVLIARHRCLLFSIGEGDNYSFIMMMIRDQFIFNQCGGEERRGVTRPIRSIEPC